MPRQLHISLVTVTRDADTHPEPLLPFGIVAEVEGMRLLYLPVETRDGLPRNFKTESAVKEHMREVKDLHPDFTHVVTLPINRKRLRK